MRLSFANLLFVLAIATGCDGTSEEHGQRGRHGEQSVEHEPDPRVLVQFASVETGSVADHLVTTGVLESELQADISPEASGVVTEVLVEEGDEVAAGAILAIISNPTLDAGATRAGINLNQARTAYEQVKSLHAQGAVSDLELREAAATWQTSRATWSEASRSRGFTRVTSPISGTVAIRDVRLGEVAGAGRAFQVVDLGRLRVVARLPEKDLPRLLLGQVALLEGAYDDSATAEGKVERISPVVDATTGTVRVTIAVNPGQSSLRPGQFVRVHLEVDRHEDTLTIPRRALVWQDGEPLAWKVVEADPEDEDEDKDGGEDEKSGWFAGLFGGGDDADTGEADADPWEGIPRRKVVKARLELGYTDPARAEILSGLEEGDMIVVVGNNNLLPDARVRLPDDPMPVYPDDDEKPEEEARNRKDGTTSNAEG